MKTNCKTYSPLTGNCLSCYIGYSLSNGGCVSNPNVYLLQGCRSISGSTCLDCSQGYYFNPNNDCELVNTLCQNFDYTTKSCVQCYGGYVYVPIIRKCIVGNIQVDLNCIFWYGYSCLGCASGYSLVNGYCSKGNSTPPNPPTQGLDYCKTRVSGICTECYQGYYLDQYAFCQLANQNCKTSNNVGGCTSCYDGYYVNNSDCVVSNNNCRTIDSSGHCTACYNGDYLDNGLCKRIDPYCADWNYSNNTCNACYGGYNKVNGVCG